MKGWVPLVAAAGAAGGAYLLLRRKSTMTPEELAKVIEGAAPTAAPWALQLAEVAIATAPRDYFADDPDAGLRRWALLLVAIPSKESAFGSAPGYFPAGDVTGWGDSGNAFGFFQLDKRYHWAFIQTNAAQSLYGQALYAARRILAPNWARFSFVKDAGERERLTVIAYNASAARVEAMVRAGGSVDAADATTTTTADGTPYGMDVLSRLADLES